MASACAATVSALVLGGCHQCPTPETTQSGYGAPPNAYYASAPPPAYGAAHGSTGPSGAPHDVLEGKAVYYGDSLAGHRTANGDVYDPRAFTAANRTLPFGTVVRVVRVDTGHSVVVRINDRGPFGDDHRIIDLSRAAAEQLDMIRAGVVNVRVEVLELGNG